MTPVQAFIAAGAGESVTISTRAGTDSTDYDPTSLTPYAPPAPTDATIWGVYGGIKTENLPQGCSGAFTIEAASKPTDLVAEQSVLTRGAQSFVIMSWAERAYMGRTDGYTLHLRS